MFSIADHLQYPIVNDDFRKQIAVFIPSSPVVIKHPLPCFRSNLEQTKKLERELLYPSSYLIHDFGKDKTFQTPVVRCKRFYDNEPLNITASSSSINVSTICATMGKKKIYWTIEM